MRRRRLIDKVRQDELEVHFQSPEMTIQRCGMFQTLMCFSSLFL